MAAASAAENPGLVGCICATFALPRGIPHPMELETALSPCLGAASTAEFFATMQTKRRTLERLWGSDKGDKYLSHGDKEHSAPAAEVLETLDSYMQMLMQATLSMEVAPEATKVDKSFAVEWPSPITLSSIRARINPTAAGTHIHSAMLYETSMLLAGRAMLLNEDAWDAVHGGTVDAKRASERLRSAAGTLDYLQNKLEEGGWSEALQCIVGPDTTPVELLGAKAFRDIFLAQAQQFAIAQAVIDGKAPASLLCKLCLGVVHNLEIAVSALRADPAIKYGKITGAHGTANQACPLTMFLAFQITLFKALANRFAAADAWAKADYGTAIGYQQRAATLLRERADISSPGLPPTVGQLGLVDGDLTSLRNEVAQTLKGYLSDNNSVYFSAVPAEDALPPLPKHIVMMKPTPLVEPDIAPMALEPGGKSDEDLARELQEQFQVEEKAAAADSPGIMDTLTSMLGGASTKDKPAADAAAAVTADEAPPDVPSAPAPPSYEAATAVGAVSSAQENRLVEMGFGREAVRKALADNNNDEGAALNSLVGGM